MRIFWRRIAVLIGLIAIIGWCGMTHAADAGLEDNLEEFVKQVIRENPELIYDVLNGYLREKKKAKAEQDFETRMKKRVDDVVAAHNPTLGPEDAPITIIEYTDFQCPYCTRGTRTIFEVLEMYPEEVRLVFKNLPLKMHEQALPAAKAALAAARQGKFWEYHDRLFAGSAAIEEGTFEKIAEELALDMEKFRTDLASEEIAREVATDMEQAKSKNITGVPTFIINGVLVTGARPFEHFEKVLERLLQEEQSGAGVVVTPAPEGPK